MNSYAQHNYQRHKSIYTNSKIIQNKIENKRISPQDERTYYKLLGQLKNVFTGGMNDTEAIKTVNETFENHAFLEKEDRERLMVLAMYDDHIDYLNKKRDKFLEQVENVFNNLKEKDPEALMKYPKYYINYPKYYLNKKIDELLGKLKTVFNNNMSSNEEIKKIQEILNDYAFLEKEDREQFIVRLSYEDIRDYLNKKRDEIAELYASRCNYILSSYKIKPYLKNIDIKEDYLNAKRNLDNVIESYNKAKTKVEKIFDNYALEEEDREPLMIIMMTKQVDFKPDKQLINDYLNEKKQAIAEEKARSYSYTLSSSEIKKNANNNLRRELIERMIKSTNIAISEQSDTSMEESGLPKNVLTGGADKKEVNRISERYSFLEKNRILDEINTQIARLAK